MINWLCGSDPLPAAVPHLNTGERPRTEARNPGAFNNKTRGVEIEIPFLSFVYFKELRVIGVVSVFWVKFRKQQ